MPDAQDALERFAVGVPYEPLAAAFLEFDRWTGDDPVLLLAEAAASTTGQSFLGGVKPTVERFRESFVDTGRVESVADLASIDRADDDLIDAFGARRKRHVLCELARVLAERPESDDLESIRSWAAEADPYRYEDDPVGAISGVGPSSFQFLRQLAGVDTVTPDPTVTRLLESLEAALGEPTLERATDDDLRTIAACEWLAAVTDYRLLEIDRIAWWTFTDADEREAVCSIHRIALEQ
ncbi:hypothetical protein ACFQGT_06680 [Natrialbaceae archaeon GCM10025810]|uniref:hypothetical protein n=1 Tax=Halovalidus salilacus TaxID=3075124 RepID=UPI00360D5129